MDDNTTADIQETEETPKDQYSIYNYLKGNPASIATVFTVLIAIVTFLAQVMTYMANKKTLVYWGFDGSYATLGTEGLLYSAIASIVQIIVQTFAQTWYMKTCEVYLERKKYYMALYYYCKNVKKITSDTKVRAKKLKRSTPLSDNLKRELTEIETDLNNRSSMLKTTIRSITRERVSSSIVFGLNSVPALFLVVYITYLATFLNDSVATLEKFSAHLIIHFVSFLLIFLIEQKILLNKKKIKQTVQELDDDWIQSNTIEQDYPLFTLLTKWKGIPNSIIISYLATLCISIFLLVNPYVTVKPNVTTNKKSFQIITIDELNYAVVHREDDLYFLEKVVVTDDTITIYTNEQRILTLEDASFTVYTFEKENIFKSESEVLP